MNPKKAKIHMWGLIALGMVSLLSQGVSLPCFLRSQLGVNPFHALKNIALISFASAIETYFTFIKIQKIANM